jgi:serine/threonine-protein phosphatase PGAM5
MTSRYQVARRLIVHQVAMVCVSFLITGFSGTASGVQPAAAAPAEAPAAVTPPSPPRTVRTLYLVRHGLYDENDPRDPFVGKELVEAGREQARKVAARLAGLPAHVDVVRCSDMTRARQTAEIIAAALPGRVPQVSHDLSECTPPTPRQDIMKTLGPGEADSCATQMDAAFAHYFRPSPTVDSTEVLVCHGNVIRYLVCRALGVDRMAWLNMGITNCSLTVVQVRADGTTRLLSFNDVGHLPAELQTPSRMVPLTPPPVKP